jgi:hypothetical protein
MKNVLRKLVVGLISFIVTTFLFACGGGGGSNSIQTIGSSQIARGISSSIAAIFLISN